MSEAFKLLKWLEQTHINLFALLERRENRHPRAPLLFLLA